MVRYHPVNSNSNSIAGISQYFGTLRMSPDKKVIQLEESQACGSLQNMWLVCLNSFKYVFKYSITDQEIETFSDVYFTCFCSHLRVKFI
jgi:hypothetical protein